MLSTCTPCQPVAFTGPWDAFIPPPCAASRSAHAPAFLSLPPACLLGPAACGRGCAAVGLCARRPLPHLHAANGVRGAAGGRPGGGLQHGQRSAAALSASSRFSNATLQPVRVRTGHSPACALHLRALVGVHAGRGASAGALQHHLLHQRLPGPPGSVDPGHHPPVRACAGAAQLGQHCLQWDCRRLLAVVYAGHHPPV